MTTSQTAVPSYFHPSFDELREDVLKSRWDHDVELRRLVPLRHLWRGCFAMAFMVDNLGNGYEHNGHMLHRNEDIRVAVMRDTPPGKFVNDPTMSRREANMVSITRPTLRHGSPAIDFTEAEYNTNFRFSPITSSQKRLPGWLKAAVERGDVLDGREHDREFAVCNAMSSSMTRFAFGALDRDGKPWRIPWAQRRPDEIVPHKATPTANKMPIPFLGYSDNQATTLYWYATENPQHPVIECPHCNATQGVTEIRNRRFFEEGGDFVGQCSKCEVEEKYFLDDAVPAKARRRFSREFRNEFLSDIVKGFPILAPADVTYLRREKADNGMTRHVFENDTCEFDLVVPRRIWINAELGGTIEAGEEITKILPDGVPQDWVRQSVNARWGSIKELLGGPQMVPYYLRLWFNRKSFQIADAPGRWFWPASLVSPACQTVNPVDMWWDLTPCLGDFDNATESVVLPPLRLGHWDHLRVHIGEIDVNANIGDSRFQADANETVERLAGNTRRKDKEQQPVAVGTYTDEVRRTEKHSPVETTVG